MKYIHTNDYYKEKKNKKINYNKSFKYRLTYVGSKIYQLTKGKYKVIKKSCSFYDIYTYIIENKISLEEIHLPYMTLDDFLKYWVTFDKGDKE